MKKVILAGNAITADILNGYLAADTRYEVVATTVDDEYVRQAGVEGLETVPLSRLKQDYSIDEYTIIMAMGYADLNTGRQVMYEKLKETGFSIETYIHPAAQVHTRYPPGEGCVILPQAVIEPHASLGRNTMLWCNTTLAHHASVSDHCWIASGVVISGQARIDKNTFIGVNATIVNKVTVAEHNIIGAGALITRDTKPSTVHLARSAEQIRFSSQEYVKYLGV